MDDEYERGSADLGWNLGFVLLVVLRWMVEHELDLGCQMHWSEVI